MIRIIATADLHYRMNPGFDPSAESLARKIVDSGGDVLVLVGDSGVAEREDDYRACLDLFRDFGGRKLLVAGNHDLWTVDGDSFEIYRDLIPRICSEHGFHYLDTGPFVVDGVGLVGNCGWYDYTFRDESLALPETAYREKILPGVIEWMDR